MLIDNVTQPSPSSDANNITTTLEIGILTRGKPTLGMVLTSLLLQEAVNVRIHVVDTSPKPVINRDDVRFALRLSADRHIECSYEYASERDRAFSLGKLKLLRALSGSHLCLMDDDVVMPSSALARLHGVAQTSGIYGYISPVCKNSPLLGSDLAGLPQYAPGSLIYQDDLVRGILLDYYRSTVDVLDRRATDAKVWETAFLTELFSVLGRPCTKQLDIFTYHLDYHEGPNWIEEERSVIGRSVAVARELATQRGVAISAGDQWQPRATSDVFGSARQSFFGRMRRYLPKARN